MDRDERFLKRATAQTAAARAPPRLLSQLGDGKEGMKSGGTPGLVSARSTRAGVGGTATRKARLAMGAGGELRECAGPECAVGRAAPFALQEAGAGLCEVAATPPALAQSAPRQVPAGYAQYQNPTLDPTTFVQWTVGQWRVMLPRELGGERSCRLLAQLLKYGAYQVGLARVGDALVPAALAPADRYMLAQSINLQPCSARAMLANDESAA